MSMPSYFTLTPAEKRQRVEFACRMFAIDSYKKNRPNCTEEDAWQDSELNWRKFLDVAFDWLATCEAIDEAHASAPWN